jgi:hypothetical protein
MDTIRNTTPPSAEELVDSAFAAAAAAETNHDTTDPDERPSTLEDADDASRYEEKRWFHTDAPSDKQWAALRHQFSRAERASVALIGVAELLKNHRLAKDSALEHGVACHSFNDFQEGCLADAESILLWVVHDTIAALKNATYGERP